MNKKNIILIVFLSCFVLVVGSIKTIAWWQSLQTPPSDIPSYEFMRSSSENGEGFACEIEISLLSTGALTVTGTPATSSCASFKKQLNATEMQTIVNTFEKDLLECTPKNLAGGMDLTETMTFYTPQGKILWQDKWPFTDTCEAGTEIIYDEIWKGYK